MSTVSEESIPTIARPPIGDPRWTALGAYFRDIADAMGVQKYYFWLSEDSPDACEDENESATLSIDISNQSLSAIVKVGDVFWSKTKYEQRWAVVHELVHVLEAPYVKALQEVLDVSSSTHLILNQLRERFIDEIAIRLAELYELPPNFQVPDKPVVKEM